MDKNLLDIICCPLTKLPLELLDPMRLDQLNAAIDSGSVQNQGEQKVHNRLAEALVSRDGHWVYPVQEGIPLLLEEQSIDFKQAV